MEEPELFQGILKPYKRSPFWKVLLLMIALGLFVGVRTCLNMRVVAQDDERRFQRERDRLLHPDQNP
jgi:hypothetical protein